VVHARGYGAHGFFELTDSLAEVTRADIFQRFAQWRIGAAICSSHHSPSPLPTRTEAEARPAPTNNLAADSAAALDAY